MALETMMAALIEALNANTAAHLGKAVPAATAAATTKTPATTKVKETAATTKVPAVTFDAVKAAAGKVKEKDGAPVAKKIISEFGKAESLNAVKPENHAALLAAFEAHLAAPEGEGDEAEDEDL